MLSRLSIRSQLILTVMTLGLCLIAWQFLAIRGDMKQTRARADEEVQNLARTLSESVGQFLGDTRFVMTQMAMEPRLQALDPATCSEPLMAVRPYLRYRVNVLAVDATGRILCSGTGPPEGGPGRYDDREWFQEVLRTGETYVSGPILGRFTNQWVAMVAHPIPGPEGEIRGVIAASLDLERFQTLLSETELPPTTLVTLAHEGTEILARSLDGSALFGQTLPPASTDLDLFQPDGGTVRTVDADGVDRVFAWDAVPGSRWVLFVGIANETLMAGPRRAMTVDLLVGFGILVLLLGLTLWVYRGVLGSLSALMDGTRAAALGDPSKVPTTGPSEVVEVGRQFRETLEAREEAETEVRLAERRWRSILENSAFGVFLTDADGRLTEGNPALAELLEEPGVGALKGRQFQTMFWDQERGQLILDALLRGESFRGLEERWRTKEDNLRIVRLTGTGVMAPSGVPRLEVFAEDITIQQDLKIQFLQAQKMEAVGRLAGGVAHDFNNLLTVIQGHSEILLTGLTPESGAYRNAREILQAAERASNLTGQLLAFSRLDGDAPHGTVDLNEVVRGMERMCRRLIGEHIAMNLDLGSPPSAPLDATRLEQVIMNLVVNARDAMPEGGTLTLRTREFVGSPDPEWTPATWAVLEVIDSGAGISPEIRDRIFDPFFTTKGPGEGSGLGLSTVFGIVTGAGGTVQVDAAPGGGTVFSVFVPAQIEEPLAALDSADSAPSGKVAPSGVVLIVEDEDQVREVMERILAHAGYRTLTAADGQEGLEVLLRRGDAIDLVVTDVMMPRLKGTELVEKLRPEFPDLPVILVSGYADGRVSQEFLEERKAGFLAKPFRPGELLERVRAILRNGGDPTLG